MMFRKLDSTDIIIKYVVEDTNSNKDALKELKKKKKTILSECEITGPEKIHIA